MAGIDLHTAVRGAITYLHPDEAVLWFRSVGQDNVKGRIVAKYGSPMELQAQIQSDSDEGLYFSNRAGDNSITRVFYLYSSRESRISGIIRPDARNGDFLQRTQDGTWWLVTGVLEDFSGVDWEKVRAVLQVTPPYLGEDEDGDGDEGGDDGDAEVGGEG